MKLRVRRVAIIALIGVFLVFGAILMVVSRQSKRAVHLSGTNSISAGAIKFDVEHAGFYRLTLPDLQRAGLKIDLIDPANLNLSQDGENIPYWTDGDALVFFGQAPESRFTQFRSYILTRNQAGRTMGVAEVGTITGPELTSVPQVLHLEENNLYDSRARYENDDGSVNTEPWYWDTIQVENRFAVNLPLDDLDVNQPALLNVSLWGATRNDGVDFDHDLDVVVNGQTVDTIRWDGETHFTSQSTIPSGFLMAGNNEIVLDNSVPGATQIDIMRLDRLSLSYRAPPVVRNDMILIPGAEGVVTLQGFSGRPQVFDISNPREPILLNVQPSEDDRLELGLVEGSFLAAVGPKGFLSPVNAAQLRDNNWHDSSNQADLVIVTTDDLAPELGPLIAARREQGLGVVVVPVAEIFDEFGSGQPMPEAITAFLRHASENWAEPKPRYLLIVG